jgi:hypothetical protein
MKKLIRNSMKAHWYSCIVIAPPPRRRPWTTIAPTSAKMLLDAPIVGCPVAMFETR